MTCVVCSLANSLVITAVGGGTEVIPFLTGVAIMQNGCFLVPAFHTLESFPASH